MLVAIFITLLHLTVLNPVPCIFGHQHSKASSKFFSHDLTMVTMFHRRVLDGVSVAYRKPWEEGRRKLPARP